MSVSPEHAQETSRRVTLSGGGEIPFIRNAYSDNADVRDVD